ncbi:MAG: ATP-binding cassette domain-containing protein, partial [Nitrososphaerota archaeon]|nr:ATP-binding cassette domain-containing protein [Nitrososphaerota archaeon]
MGNTWRKKDILLEAKRFSVFYSSPRGQIKAVDDVDIDLDSKEIVGLAGESGSGKSTFAIGMLRLMAPPGRIVG